MEEGHLLHALLDRLERIPADSRWAHRASGLRGSLLAAREALSRGQAPDSDRLEALVASGFRLLERAAEERCAR